MLYSQIETDFSLFSSKHSRSPFENSFFIKKGELGFSQKNDLVLVNKQRKLYQFNYNFSVQSCIWHPRKLCAFLGTKNFQIFSWSINLTKSKKILPPYFSSFFEGEGLIKEEILFLDFNSLGTLIGAGTLSGYLFVFSETGKILKKKNFHSGAIKKLKWSENSKFLVSIDFLGRALVWSSWYSKIFLKISFHLITMVDFFWIGKENFSIWSRYQIVTLFNLKEKTFLILKVQIKKVNRIAFSEKEKLFASCSEEGKISLWNSKFCFGFLFHILSNQNSVSWVLFEPPKFRKEIKSLYFSLFCGSVDGSVKIWNIRSQKCSHNIKKNFPVFSMALGCSDLNLLLGSLGRISLFNYSAKKIRNIEIKSKIGIFIICSHSMLNKFLGCNSENFFYF
mmetsp:Transcript_28173/g.57149  ORF Transcript_28173/g.57149 Transcript_28173/m.57149 type:complete len:393 (+) Transcript_28173:6119-7297(+)